MHGKRIYVHLHRESFSLLEVSKNGDAAATAWLPKDRIKVERVGERHAMITAPAKLLQEHGL